MNLSTESVSTTTSVTNEDENKLEFQIRPPIEKKFSKDRAKEIIHGVLAEELNNKQYKENEMEDVIQSIAVTLKGRFRASIDADYKLIVHVIMGEQRGAGVRSVARCLWDSATDATATMPYENESLFCVATVFAVYYY